MRLRASMPSVGRPGSGRHGLPDHRWRNDAAGVGGSIITLMERGAIDFMVSTGANLYHDIHHALDYALHRGSFKLNDPDLHEAGVIRIYDVLFLADSPAGYRMAFRVRCHASASGSWPIANCIHLIGQSALERCKVGIKTFGAGDGGRLLEVPHLDLVAGLTRSIGLNLPAI